MSRTGSEIRKIDVSIVIVNWNSVSFLRQCLSSIYQHTAGLSFEVVVVDGGSFDGCDQMLSREFPQVIFVQSPENVGFARANNLGVRHCAGEFLLLLNPDTELHENSVAAMLNALKSMPQAGAVGCCLLNTDRTIQTSCLQSFPTVANQVLDAECLRRLFPRSSLWGMAPLHTGSKTPAEVEGISGACILVKRSVFEAVGGFSKQYFMYGEDLDLCFKIRTSGYHLYYVPDTSIVHFGGGCTAGKQVSNFSNVMMRESVYRFLRTHRGRFSAESYRTAMAVTSLLRMIVSLPLLLLPGTKVVRHGSGTLRKWFGILRWSCGFESWTRKYS